MPSGIFSKLIKLATIPHILAPDFSLRTFQPAIRFIKAKIKERLKKDYEITDSKEDEAILNSLAKEGYEDIEGVPAIDKTNYDENEELIKK